MKFLPILLLITLVVLSACQKEIDFQLQRPMGDTVAHVTTVLRVVELDLANGGNDSIVRVIKRIDSSGTRRILVSEVYSTDPLDTTVTILSYDAQNHVKNVKVISTLNPSLVYTNYDLTWSGNRLTRATADTLGIRAEQYDFTYTPSGANTVVTVQKTPSDDISLPDRISTYRHKLAVNAQFLPVEEQWISYSYAGPSFGGPISTCDTVNTYYNGYSGNNLLSYHLDLSRHDTTTSVINVLHDTAVLNYTRTPQGGNIADTLRKLYGNELYTFLNFDIFNLGYVPYLIGEAEGFRYFFSNPLSNLMLSTRIWENGVFDPQQSLTNVVYNKADNSFDSQGRLARIDVYNDYDDVNKKYALKFTYP